MIENNNFNLFVKMTQNNREKKITAQLFSFMAPTSCGPWAVTL